MIFEYKYVTIINKVRYYSNYNKWECVHLLNSDNKTLEIQSAKRLMILNRLEKNKMFNKNN